MVKEEKCAYPKLKNMGLLKISCKTSCKILRDNALLLQTVSFVQEMNSKCERYARKEPNIQDIWILRRPKKILSLRSFHRTSPNDELR